MDKEKEKTLAPGDEGYPGGDFRSTVVIDGKARNVRTVKDEKGNVVFLSASEKIFGLF